MLPISIGVSLALAFSLLAGAVYGPQALAGEPWVLLTQIGLLAGPVMMCLARRADAVR